jgi:hypothetical protein
LAVDLAWRERPSSAPLEFLVLIHEAASTRGFFGSNPEASGPERGLIAEHLRTRVPTRSPALILPCEFPPRGGP